MTTREVVVALLFGLGFMGTMAAFLLPILSVSAIDGIKAGAVVALISMGLVKVATLIRGY